MQKRFAPAILVVLCVALAALGCRPPTYVGTAPIPATQQVAAWWIDPVNGSDSNNGQSVGAPLQTWHQLNDALWGCSGGPNQCPRLRQNTTITWLSSATTNADPVYFFPSIENGAVVILQGNLPTPTVGTITNVTAMNRATPQILLAQSGAAATGVLVKDTQATHVSFAWTYALSSGSIYKMSQPLAPLVLPTQTLPAELNNWTNTDTDAVYTPLQAVNLANIQPTVVDVTSAGVFTNSGVYLYHLLDFDPLGAGNSVTNLNAAVWGVESSFQRSLTISGDASVAQEFFNCYFTGPIQGGPSNVQMLLVGGVLNPASGSITLQNTLIDGDTLINASPLLTASGVHGTAGFGTVEVESGKTLNAAGGGTIVANTSTYNGNAPVQWGAGTVNVASGTRLIYPAGSGKAAATFLGTLNLNGQTKACLSFPANSATTQVCNISLTAANVDTNLGATNTGCMTGGQAGGALCNGSQ